ncbi:GNAT family N-acetyltransferase [Streptomyces sp. NBC_01220]|uniref:GNAT family N-acetyltransferase n=1 Tax=unclassified Streptomyces TaxID=2593676 RepID=UPI002E2D013B|nr:MULTISPECIES: GNAT family N-acetyltransferase [unclassified Streptomyces]WSQ44857.1 GNAT family N-acetyltransferase [Streptomyces sp. NBC_01220]
MNNTLINELRIAYDAQLRGVTPPGGSTSIEKDGPLTRVVGWHRGFVTGPRDLGVYGAELDALITRQRDFYAARGEAVEWKTRAHDLPADLADRLSAAGFVAEETETVLIGQSAALAADPALPGGVTLRRVTAYDDLQRIAAMESAVWGEDWSWLADDLAARIEGNAENTVVLVAEAGTEVVCAAWLVFKDGIDFAGLWGGSTLEEWRGKGIYRAMVAHRAQLAAARDVPYLYVDASADSAPILTRLGLHKVTTTTPYVWSP